MNPQNQQESDSTIDRLASAQMGVAPAMSDAPAQADPEAGRPAEASTSIAKEKETPTEKATSEGSPETEADKMDAEAIMYEIDFGDGSGKRQLTPEQIKSTYGRYKDLNYQHSQMKPIMEVANAIMQKEGINDPRQLAEAMLNIAQGKNLQMGGQDARPNTEQSSPGPQSAEEISDAFSKWEEDNAVSLPPGYKELGGAMQNMMAMQSQQQQMLQQVLAGNQAVADAARDTQQDAQSQRNTAISHQVANNLDRAQAQLGLNDDQAQDFMMFAQERGYTIEDFVDPTLTLTVVTDFKNMANTDEMERLRSIARRRQAFTGSLGPTPASGGEAPAPGSADSDFERLVTKAMG